MTLDEDLAARGLPALKGPGRRMRLADRRAPNTDSGSADLHQCMLADLAGRLHEENTGTPLDEHDLAAIQNIAGLIRHALAHTWRRRPRARQRWPTWAHCAEHSRRPRGCRARPR
jgi:hypothetical protein